MENIVKVKSRNCYGILKIPSSPYQRQDVDVVGNIRLVTYKSLNNVLLETGETCMLPDDDIEIIEWGSEDDWSE